MAGKALLQQAVNPYEERALRSRVRTYPGLMIKDPGKWPVENRENIAHLEVILNFIYKKGISMKTAFAAEA